MKTPGTCVVCSRGLVSAKTWAPAPPEQRAAWKAQGLAKGVRVDMCAADHEKLSRSGDLAKYPTTVRLPVEAAPSTDWTHCRRCGVSELHSAGLCRDCVETVAREGERHRWVA